MSQKESKLSHNSTPASATRHGSRHATAPSSSHVSTASSTRHDSRHVTAPSSSNASTASSTRHDSRHAAAPSSSNASTAPSTLHYSRHAAAPSSNNASTAPSTLHYSRHAAAPSSSNASTAPSTRHHSRLLAAPSSSYTSTASATQHDSGHTTAPNPSYALTTSTTQQDSRHATATNSSYASTALATRSMTRDMPLYPTRVMPRSTAPATWHDSRHATVVPGFISRYASYAGNNLQQLEAQARLQKYFRIGGDYCSITQVAEALAQAGVESSNLIVGINFTKSNKWAGKKSYSRPCLHDPYEQAISIIGRTLSDFDDDNLIPCFGFGDASTRDQEVFSFYPENQPCNGFEEALKRYREIVPTVRLLAGPTSLAPMIETAIGIVDSSGGQYHVLLIIADGQVTPSVDTQSGQLSPQERDTIDAIVKASYFPLSIVLVGVGDGPWDMMHKFDNIPARIFHNFQFVNFTDIMSKSIAADRKEAEFALSALMGIPTQYRAILDLQLLGRRYGIPPRVPLPPPTRNPYSRSSSFVERTGAFQQAGSFRQTRRPERYASGSSQPEATGIPGAYAKRSSFGGNYAGSFSEDRLLQLCAICMDKLKDLAFGCGHQTCCDCGKKLVRCPMCQQHITTRIKLY